MPSGKPQSASVAREPFNGCKASHPSIVLLNTYYCFKRRKAHYKKNTKKTNSEGCCINWRYLSHIGDWVLSHIWGVFYKMKSSLYLLLTTRLESGPERKRLWPVELHQVNRKTVLQPYFAVLKTPYAAGFPHPRLHKLVHCCYKSSRCYWIIDTRVKSTLWNCRLMD